MFLKSVVLHLFKDIYKNKKIEIRERKRREKCPARYGIQTDDFLITRHALNR